MKIKFSYQPGISIHTLRMEGDPLTLAGLTRPNISIHTLRMEGDGWQQRSQRRTSDFNPHPPHGG